MRNRSETVLFRKGRNGDEGGRGKDLLPAESTAVPMRRNDVLYPFGGRGRSRGALGAGAVVMSPHRSFRIAVLPHGDAACAPDAQTNNYQLCVKHTCMKAGNSPVPDLRPVADAFTVILPQCRSRHAEDIISGKRPEQINPKNHKNTRTEKGEKI